MLDYKYDVEISIRASSIYPYYNIFIESIQKRS